MAIQALYPSRMQSQLHNPLFDRERRRRKIAIALSLGAGLIALVGLRIMPGDASAEVRAPAVRTLSVTPAATAVWVAQQRKVRIIPLYSIPSE